MTKMNKQKVNECRTGLLNWFIDFRPIIYKWELSKSFEKVKNANTNDLNLKYL